MTAKMTDAELIATRDADKIALRAASLSGGELVNTQGARAARLYREAARIERETGHDTHTLLAFRANRHEELAAWCDDQQEG